MMTRGQRWRAVVARAQELGIIKGDPKLTVSASTFPGEDPILMCARLEITGMQTTDQAAIGLIADHFVFMLEDLVRSREPEEKTSVVVMWEADKHEG